MRIRQLSKVLMVTMVGFLISPSPQADQQRERIGIIGTGDSEAYQDVVVARLTREGWISTEEQVQRLRIQGFVISDQAVIRSFSIGRDEYGAASAMLHLAMYRPDHVIAFGDRAGKEVAANVDAPVSVLRAPEAIAISE